MHTAVLLNRKTISQADRWALLGLLLLFILGCAHSGRAQGYIYVHKKTLDETSSPDFTYSVSGGSTAVPNFQLNDKPDQIQLGDIGSSANGRLWAVGEFDHILYYRNAGATNWVATSVTDAVRVDGGPAGTAYYVTTGGVVKSHDGTTATTISGSINAVDIGSGWDNQPYATNSSGDIIRYSGAGTTWNPFFNNAETLVNLDVSPSDGYIYATSATSVQAFQISPAGVGVSMSKPTDVTTSGPKLYDIATDALGNVFTTGFSSVGQNRFVYKWGGGTSWGAPEATTNQITQITGGLGGQIWGINRLSWDVNGYPYHNIFSRALDGTTNWWIDDERVRTSVTNGNSELIAVASGTYTITEAVPGGWDLQKITVYDPSSNSTSNLSAHTATVTVANNEVVHVIFQNGLINPFAMTNSCTTVYTENFGTGNIGTFGPAFVGQTSYHYLGNSTPGEDGYYKVVSSGSDFNSWSEASGFLDHTTNNGTGRMLAINASYDQNEFFRRRFTGVVPGADYDFSAWIANLTPGAVIDPNVSFQIIDPATNTVIASNTTGPLTGSTAVWTQYSLQFTATTSVIDLVLVNNTVGGNGNDLAIDDIVFKMSPPAVATTTVVNGSCAGNGSITVTSPVGASYEYSLDGTTYQSAPTFTNLSAGTYTVYTRFVSKPTCVSTKVDKINSAICGNVFNDANGLTDNTVNGPGVNGTTLPLYASLVSNGVVIATVPITSTGTYSFTNVANGTYSVVLTTNSAGSATPSLPANWVSTGENVGTAAGNDGSVNTILPVTVNGASVSNANFGIEQRPVVTGGTNAPQANPGGTVAAPVSSTLFTGTDPEDGAYPNNLTGRTVTLTPATNGTLYYNGTPITTTTVIPNFDPTKVTLDPTATGATTGAGGAAPDPTFTYTVKDNAGVESLPKTIIVPFTAPMPVSLVSFTAKTQADQTVLLEWTTSWERSNKGYTLERSKDLITFERVGQVSDVAGTSNSINSYRFVDATPYSGTSYYRLSQTDLDGTTKVFPAVSVVLRREAYGIFPNPVRDGQFTLNLDEPLTAVVNLYTADGRPVSLHKSATTDSSLHLKATQPLTPGVYVLIVAERGQTRQYRIVIN